METCNQLVVVVVTRGRRKKHLRFALQCTRSWRNSFLWGKSYWTDWQLVWYFWITVERDVKFLIHFLQLFGTVGNPAAIPLIIRDGNKKELDLQDINGTDFAKLVNLLKKKPFIHQRSSFRRTRHTVLCLFALSDGMLTPKGPHPSLSKLSLSWHR